MQLRLTPEQNDEKREAEDAVKELEDELQAETDETKQEALKAEVTERKEKLSTLVDGFQVSIWQSTADDDHAMHHQVQAPPTASAHSRRKWQSKKLKPEGG